MKERNIAEILNGFRKGDLEDLGSLLGHDFPSCLRKPELVRHLTGYLTDHPRQWLSHLLERDIRLLKDLVRSGPGKVRYLDRSEYFTLLEISGLVDHDDSDGSHRKVWVRREVYDIVSPHIDQVIRSGEKSGRFALERIGLGFLNLYGILPVDHFIALMLDYHDAAFGTGYDADALVRSIGKSPLFRVFRSTDEYGDYLCSPCVADVGEIFRVRSEISQDGCLHDFCTEDVLEAGTGAPYFTVGFKTPEGRALTDLLQRIGYDGFDLVRAQHDIWREAQLPFGSNALFDPVVAREGSIPSDHLYQKCLQAIVDYANIVPKWVLNGYNALEKDYLVLEYPEPEETLPAAEDDAYPKWSMPRPTISDGYTDLIEKDGKLELLSSLMPEGFPFGLAIPHVAPEDPCPCGSGLRYAHCHGKNPS